MKNARRSNVVLLAASYLSSLAQEEDKINRLKSNEELNKEPVKMVLNNPYSELDPINYTLPIKTKQRKGGNNRKGHKRKKAKNGRNGKK